MSCHPLRPRVSPILLIALLLIALLAAACNERSSPTEPPPPLVSAPGAAPSTISRIEVTSPGTLAPQASVQLVALAYKGDGSVEVVSKLTRWSSEAPDVVAVTPDGLATGMRVGETRVTANFHSGRTYYGAAPVVVLIPGTYKVSGRVMDSGVPIANASVSSDGGERMRHSTTSDSEGRFALYGVAGRVRLQASREGYVTVFHDLDVGQHVTKDLEMQGDRQRLDLSGSYVLTLRLGACEQGSQAGFTEQLSSRRYTALVFQTGGTLAVSLVDADFIVRNGRGDRFDGSVDPLGQVRFDLGDPDDVYLADHPDLAEHVADNAFMAAGRVDARATTSEVSGRLAGVLGISDAATPSLLKASTRCYSSQHAFEMRRR